ncbi:hypothetical protein A3839_28140 [Achromobacter insolitus]|nr:hypothetical protein A3839_28140 [Achromobacter insolitus]
MKNWSFAKLMAVLGGGFVAFVIAGLVVVRMISGTGNAQKRTPTQPQVSDVNRGVDAAKTASPSQAQQSTGVGLDIVSVQLEGAQTALREAKEETQALEKKVAQALANRDEANNKQIQGILEQITSLNKRLTALEEDRLLNSGVSVVKPEATGQGADETSADTPAKATYVPPKGFTLRAELGNRVWLFDGHREFSMLKTDPPPKAPAVAANGTAQRERQAPKITAATTK